MLNYVFINETSLQQLKDPSGKHDLNVAKPVYLMVPEIKTSTSFNLPVSETQAMTLTLGLFSPVHPHSPNCINTKLWYQ